jgi:hypothetical protein
VKVLKVLKMLNFWGLGSMGISAADHGDYERSAG